MLDPIAITPRVLFVSDGRRDGPRVAHLARADRAPAPAVPDCATLVPLARDLPAVWRAPGTSMRLKQRIVWLLLREVIADITATPPTIALTLR